MAVDLREPLVIGISSRALFDLEEENRIYEEEGLEAYSRWQIEHERDVLRKGPAFNLVSAFLSVNSLVQDRRLTEVIVMSRGRRWPAERRLRRICMRFTRTSFSRPMKRTCGRR